MAGERTLGDRIWYKRWPPQVPKCLHYPDYGLGDFLRQAVSKYGSGMAVSFLHSSITYDQLWELVMSLAAGLSRIGLKKGDVCAVMLPNSHQYVICYYACHLLGVTVTAINPTYKALEIQHQLKDSGARALIVLDAVYNEAERGLQGSEVQHVISTNVVDLCGFSPLKRWLGKLIKKIPSAKTPSDVLSFTKILHGTTSSPPTVRIDPSEEIAVLQYTGGTTGLPKGAMLTHRNVIANALQCEAWLWKRRPGMGIIGVLPLFHSYAMTTVMNAAIRLGGFQLLLPRPPSDMTELFKLIEKYGPGHGFIMPGVSVLFNKINNHPRAGDFDLSSLIMAVSGAGPLPLDVQDQFEKITGAIIVEGYGLSEASPVTHANPMVEELRKQGTIGLPYPDTDIKIMDGIEGTREIPPLPFSVAKTGGLTPEQSREADAYTGELVVKGPQVMKGYLNRPEETALALRDGWLYTGDMACMDAEGFTIIRDRAKDMIKFKGYPVFPAEVEDLLHRHPHIQGAAVIGVPDQEMGERVKAFVVLDPDKRGQVSAEDIIRWARDKITHYKIPSVIEFRDNLPTTMVGKVLRRALKEKKDTLGDDKPEE
ncbi:MAG: long-chain fatty acid--CoA ligase [Deltaproteobacteria bacterium]|nr:long-chain fatty acid--CoA ligase [Deltaproteobacteria bacterium]MBW2136928.1 long-chain fatty acid--CoA ligase [Deltaproteobacteria bacterium]